MIIFVYFVPKKNFERFNASCETLFFPTFDSKELLECLYDLLRIDKDWIPRQHGYSLYIRPTILSTAPDLSVSPASNVKLYIILSPVGPYFKEGFKAVKLLADCDHYIRAWPKGHGNKKIGGNYGPAIPTQEMARQLGYSQIMWLLENINDHEHYITEVGTMNQFFFWINSKTNKKELITPPLDGIILPGVTRDSIIQICKEWNEFEVIERPIKNERNYSST